MITLLSVSTNRTFRFSSSRENLCGCKEREVMKKNNFWKKKLR
jgi:hypothetical protein